MVVIFSQAFLPRNGANRLIMGWCHRITIVFSDMQRQQSLALCWCSFVGRGNEHINCLFGYNGDQYICFGVMWHYSSLIVEWERLKIVDAPLTIIFGWANNKQPSYSQSLYATNCIHVVHIQYCISNYFCLHPEAFWPLDFWSISMHVMSVRDDVALLHSCAFGQQLMACRSFYQFLINIAQLSHLSSSSSFSSICMTYHKQLSTIRTMCTRSVRRVTWLDLWIIQRDSRHAHRFILSTDRSLYDSYDITHLIIVSILCH